MNMLLNCAECGTDWVEVPIRTVYLNDKNTYSHFHPFKDSLRIYQSILKFSGSCVLKTKKLIFLYLSLSYSF